MRREFRAWLEDAKTAREEYKVVVREKHHTQEYEVARLEDNLMSGRTYNKNYATQIAEAINKGELTFTAFGLSAEGVTLVASNGHSIYYHECVLLRRA